MNELITISFLGMAIIVTIILSIVNKKKYSLGPRQLEFEETKEINDLLVKHIKNAIKHHRIAFTLLWIAASISFLFGVLLLANIFFYTTTNENITLLISEAVGIAGGGVATISFSRIYNKTSKIVDVYLARI